METPLTLLFPFHDIFQSLMDDIFHYWRERLDPPWENRLTFGLDTEEGAALLASPNGIAAAWLHIHRAGDMGKRTPGVTNFQPWRRQPLYESGFDPTQSLERVRGTIT